MTPQDSDLAILSGGSLDQVTEAELRRFAELIYARTGIHVSPQKRTLLSNRLRRRLRVTGIADFAQYYDHLRRLRPNDAEWDAFLQEITTHETYLFRDEGQWDWLAGNSWQTATPRPARANASGRCESGRPPAAPATRP